MQRRKLITSDQIVGYRNAEEYAEEQERLRQRNNYLIAVQMVRDSRPTIPRLRLLKWAVILFIVGAGGAFLLSWLQNP